MHLVELKNGPTVRASAIELSIQLEARGHVLTADAGVLKCTNGSALTADDRAAIMREKPHLIAIAEYCKERPYER